MEPYVYYFSFITGRIERIETEDIKTLETYQIPLFRMPNKSCKACYGRGHCGFNTSNQVFEPCKCVKKVIDPNNGPKGQLSFYVPTRPTSTRIAK